MSWYALRLGSNKTGQRYLKPICFIVDGGNDVEDLPLVAASEEEMATKLKDHPLYEAGYIEIVELED